MSMHRIVQADAQSQQASTSQAPHLTLIKPRAEPPSRLRLRNDQKVLGEC